MSDPEVPLSRRAAREASRSTPRSARQPRPSSDAEPSTKAAGNGLSAALRRHPRAVLASALSVAFVLLGTGSVFAGIAVGSAEAVEVAPISDGRTPTPEPDPQLHCPRRLSRRSASRTCSIDTLAQE